MPVYVPKEESADQRRFPQMGIESFTTLALEEARGDLRVGENRKSPFNGFPVIGKKLCSGLKEMIIKEVIPLDGAVLRVVDEEGRVGVIDMGCYLNSPAFALLKTKEEFVRVRNGKYFVEWDCGADLSADTLEDRMQWAPSESDMLMVEGESVEYNVSSKT